MRRPLEGAAPRSLIACAVAGMLLPFGAFAQSAAASAGRPLGIEYGASLRQVFTDNADLTEDKQAESITEASASLRLRANSGRIRGTVDYSLSASIHSRGSDANEVRHRLGANATAELIEGFAFVDMQASYAPRAVSAFGVQSRDSAFDVSNRTDVASLSLSPYLRGRLGGAVSYNARLALQSTRAKNTLASDVDSAALSFNLDGPARAGLGWFANASHTVTDFKATRQTFDTLARLGLSWQIGYDLRIGANVGGERTDQRVIGGESLPTWGAFTDWRPSERTTFTANFDRRFFGNSHALRFVHRTPNTSWALTSSRDVATQNSEGVGNVGTVYEILFRQAASIYPDEAQRDAYVRALLRTLGVNPNSVIIGGFLASAATIRDAQTASAALVGYRNTVTLQLSTSRDRRADEFTSEFDDFKRAQVVRSRGLSLDWAFRSTPHSTFSATALVNRSEGDGTADLRTTLKSLSAQWTGSLGARSYATAGIRHAESDGETRYDENSIFGSVSIRF